MVVPAKFESIVAFALLIECDAHSDKAKVWRMRYDLPPDAGCFGNIAATNFT
ncbi:hypothetical protein [Hyphomicrobium sp.]|uniref:hypothetical protein n=1 Tax=Hyphomicrobium sp. TaxID=82 RepID=UPI0025BDF6E2|nr:hypothetical protein [Hyphomicrobium sp.]